MGWSGVPCAVVWVEQDGKDSPLRERDVVCRSTGVRRKGKNPKKMVARTMGRASKPTGERRDMHHSSGLHDRVAGDTADIPAPCGVPGAAFGLGAFPRRVRPLRLEDANHVNRVSPQSRLRECSVLPPTGYWRESFCEISVPGLANWGFSPDVAETRAPCVLCWLAGFRWDDACGFSGVELLQQLLVGAAGFFPGSSPPLSCNLFIRPRR